MCLQVTGWVVRCLVVPSELDWNFNLSAICSNCQTCQVHWTKKVWNCSGTGRKACRPYRFLYSFCSERRKRIFYASVTTTHLPLPTSSNKLQFSARVSIFETTRTDLEQAAKVFLKITQNKSNNNYEILNWHIKCLKLTSLDLNCKENNKKESKQLFQ